MSTRIQGFIEMLAALGFICIVRYFTDAEWVLFPTAIIWLVFTFRGLKKLIKGDDL